MKIISIAVLIVVVAGGTHLLDRSISAKIGNGDQLAQYEIEACTWLIHCNKQH